MTAHVISIFECQSLLKLQDSTPEDLLDKLFGNYKGFRLNRDEFKELFRKSFPHVLKESPESINDALDRVFTLSDRDCDGYIDADEFGKGIGIFTSKRLSSNFTRDFFYYLDKDFKGTISEKELNEFISSVKARDIVDPALNVDTTAIFEVIHKTNPNRKGNQTTYWQFYRNRNLDAIKKLEAIFATTSSKSPNASLRGSQTGISKPYTPLYGGSNSNSQVLLRKPAGQDVSPTYVATKKLENQGNSRDSLKSSQISTGPTVIKTFDDFVGVARATGLSTINAKELVALLKVQLQDVEMLNLDRFVGMFAELFQGKYKSYHKFKDQLTAIFNYLDGNGNGVLDVDEIMNGFIHMGTGSERDKIEAAFMMIDKDGSGFIDFSEMFSYFKQMFLVSIPNDKGLSAEKFEEEISEIATATATDVFNTVDLNGDGTVSLEEFIYWYENDGSDPAAFEAAKRKSQERKQVLEESQKPPKTLYEIQKELAGQNAYASSVEELRKLLPFDKIHIETAITTFKKDYDMESMPLPDFIKYIEAVVKNSGLNISNKSLIKEAATKVFSLIDDNANGTLDLHEVATGLSLLCGGTATEKLRAAFILHDRDNSNTLDLNELVSYMETIFRIVGNNNKSELVQQTKPEELAHLTAVQCFNECKVSLDSSLPYESFRQWFIAASSIVDNASTVKSLVLRLHPGEDIIPTLVNFAKKNNLGAVTVSTGVGSVHDCTLRLAESSKMVRFKGPFEIVSITGTFSEDGLSHIHLALSDGETGKVIGGHMPQFPREGATDITDPSCKVRTTLEIALLIHEELNFKRPVDTETDYDELVVFHSSSSKGQDHRDEL